MWINSIIWKPTLFIFTLFHVSYIDSLVWSFCVVILFPSYFGYILVFWRSANVYLFEIIYQYIIIVPSNVGLMQNPILACLFDHDHDHQTSLQMTVLSMLCLSQPAGLVHSADWDCFLVNSCNPKSQPFTNLLQRVLSMIHPMSCDGFTTIHRVWVVVIINAEDTTYKHDAGMGVLWTERSDLHVQHSNDGSTLILNGNTALWCKSVPALVLTTSNERIPS